MAEYLNLPTEENQDRIATAIEQIAKIGKVDDYTNSPGSKVLAGGNRENGFYGFVQPREFGEIEDNPEGNKNMSASNLALTIGLTNGVAINEATAWMKFSRGGEIYLVPVKPLRRSVTWDAIYNQGAVYGSGGIGVNPPGGRVGPRLSANGSANAFVIEPDSEGGWLRSGAVTAAVGDTIVARGFSNSDNNGEFTVLSITDTNIVVDGNLFDEAAGNKNASVHKKSNEVTQNRDVVIGGNRYRVQLLKGAATDPLDSYNDADRGLVGPASEWNNLILPLHEQAKLQNWAYRAYAGETEDWGIGLTDADLVTHNNNGLGSYTWCQESSDVSPYRRVIRGFYGASFGTHYISWYTYSDIGWRPALRLLS